MEPEGDHLHRECPSVHPGLPRGLHAVPPYPLRDHYGGYWTGPETPQNGVIWGAQNHRFWWFWHAKRVENTSFSPFLHMGTPTPYTKGDPSRDTEPPETP